MFSLCPIEKVECAYCGESEGTPRCGLAKDVIGKFEYIKSCPKKTDNYLKQNAIVNVMNARLKENQKSRREK